MQTRRQFLFTVIAGAFVSGVPAYVEPSHTSGYLAIADKLTSLVINKDSALVIGKAYHNLSNSISADIPSEIFSLLKCINLSKKEFLNLDNGHLLLQIKNSIEHDFDKGNVEQINGWLLSKTEIKLCHILSLIQTA